MILVTYETFPTGNSLFGTIYNVEIFTDFKEAIASGKAWENKDANNKFFLHTVESFLEIPAWMRNWA